MTMVVIMTGGDDDADVEEETEHEDGNKTRPLPRP